MPDSPLPKVRFKFNAESDSHVWRIVSLHAREAVSELYSVALELACDDLGADPDALLGDKCEALIIRDDHERAWRGFVHRVEHRGVAQGHVVCRAHLVPALYGMSQRVDSYIFQDMTVPQILAVVLAEGLSPYGRTYTIDKLSRDYPVREYCAQHRESDLEFVMRLMADEGIAFWFDHTGDAEVMVLSDHKEAHTAITTMDGQPVLIQGPEAGTAAAERVRHFELAHSLESTSAVVRDFDWTQPRLGIPGNGLSAEDRGTDLRGRDREVYEYPAPLTIGDYAKPQYGAHDQVAQAAVRHERFRSLEGRFTGDGEVTVFNPGQTFELTGHRVSGFDRKYLLTRVEHFGFAPEQLTADVTPAEAQRERYRNTFECLDAGVVFRPTRTARRPVISGAQTATVVGPAGEEIYTDEHGRIKVQFHWDRVGARDEHSSCWLRVSQTWAGSGWGFMFIPRIGMEVVVTFLEGNPDRPLVTGCVYNGENTPSYTLPDDKTRSWIRTNSSHTTGGYNELRFEDLAGSEEIYLRAEKDFNEYVKHDHTTTVDNDQTNTVHGSQTETVDGNQTLTVHTNRTKTIDGNESIHIKGQQNITIDGGGSGGDDPPPAPGAGLFVTGEYTVEATSKITLKVGGSTIVIDAGSITCTSGGNSVMKLDANADLKASGAGQVYLTANADMHSAAGSQVYLTGDADMHSSGNAQVFLTANADMHSSGGSQVLLDGNAQMTTGGNATVQGGGTATVAAPTSTLAGGGGAVEASGGGVTAAGGQVNVSGGMVNISGGLVKIN
ncbi:MAG: type VI secretion system tip protein TssI/VgrG [Polyangiales bacterium]